ncbi:hypothetical protein [Paenibacillus qinlingensis]|uniref:Uncharacterized protein n=1 Tax=Paenibacillus qinlingensis TaxID=1837343 RepID=A0ABU1NTC8_9BACL|nr:hypothetical protein [Paenibacillus qinlingensis]MDR6550740.1 hypothetical protein [Paenibacillus qinlingensis]
MVIIHDADFVAQLLYWREDDGKVIVPEDQRKQTKLKPKVTKKYTKRKTSGKKGC